MKESKKQDPVEAAAISLARGLAGLFKTMYYGAGKIKNVGFAVILVLSVAGSAAAWLNRDLIFAINAPVYARWILLGVLLGFPVLYLIILGSSQTKAINSFYKDFAEINFMGKDKKYPSLLWVKEDGKKEILAFKSNISIETWRKSIPALETALDRHILKIEPLSSKKKVKLITVDTSYVLPTNILWKDEYISPKDGVIVIGENALEKIIIDLNRTPHVLAAGETGSGKSVILRTMLWQLVNKHAVLFMLDFKGGVEFGIEYEQYGEVITDRKKALELLDLLVKENEIRLSLFREKGVKNLKEYNNRTGENLSRIGLVCDEIAEMLDKKGAGKEDKELIEQLDGRLSTLARLSRATGINLLLGVQRPDANVLTGQIKNNVPVRICGRFADKPASEIVLGNTKAVDLPDVKGRFLYKAGADTVEFQAYYFDDETMLGDVENRAELSVMLPQLARRLEKVGCADAVPKASKKANDSTGRASESKNEVVLNLDY